ncbi:APC family permease [Paramicrobacterium agarici]|uniref:APC family permease n=1 Tax=Paramicrobacterium agarici TaxID=630514 RepID=UPI001173F343|nr:APC family permease [Microbacterium agarici]TQO22819.1 amino acid/polyamine/organocation transporter (APC superfamily) [Microbacterium agarici]
MSRNVAATDAAPTRRLGVPAITLMIIAASAPLTVVAGGATTAFSVTGSLAIPIGYIVLAIALGIFAVGYAAMSRHITNAGAFYAYAAQGLGRPVGVGVSLVALIAYNCMQIGIYGMLGFQVSDFVSSMFGVTIPWWLVVIVCIAIVGWMGVNRIDLSAKVLGVLVALEFLVVIVFDVAAFANPTESFTAQPISPAEIFTPAIGAVLAFGVAAFMGFEQAAIYGEEAKDPKRTVTRATFTAVGIIGVFYALSSWALSLAIGTEKITSAGISPEEAGPPLFFNFAATHLGVIVVDIMSVLFITSVFAAVVSFHNAVARYVFSLGREQLLPRGLARVSRSGAPWAGSVAQTVLALVVVVLFAIGGIGSELGALYPVITLFTWLTNTGAMGLVLLMAVIALSVIGYFRRNPNDAGPWTTLVSPIIAFLFLATVYVLIVANFNVLMGQAETNALTFVLPLLVVVPGIIGIVWGIALKSSRPEVYENIGRGAPDLLPDAEVLDAQH